MALPGIYSILGSAQAQQKAYLLYHRPLLASLNELAKEKDPTKVEVWRVALHITLASEVCGRKCNLPPAFDGAAIKYAKSGPWQELLLVYV
eukprot:872589-Pelagomonas_calceolata.AAC.1